jgi:FAD/FMN-containing dehydrogenase
MYAPPAPHVRPKRVGELVLSILISWTGSPEAGEQALAPLRALATPVADAVSPIPYPGIYRFTAHQEARHGWSIRSMFADDLSDAALDAALATMRRATTPFSIIQFRRLGGAAARVPSDATVFAHRNQRYFLAIIGVWLDPADDASRHQQWVQSLWQQVRHEGSGVYVNFLEEHEGAERMLETYPPATYARLAEVKRRYDPHNLFKFNQNIEPPRVDTQLAA